MRGMTQQIYKLLELKHAQSYIVSAQRMLYVQEALSAVAIHKLPV